MCNVEVTLCFNCFYYLKDQFASFVANTPFTWNSPKFNVGVYYFKTMPSKKTYLNIKSVVIKKHPACHRVTYNIEGTDKMRDPPKSCGYLNIKKK